MMRLQPDKRATAKEMVNHRWLDGVLVQGEIDQILAAEENERRTKERERERGRGRESLGVRSKSGSGSRSSGSASTIPGQSNRRPSGPRERDHSKRRGQTEIQALNEAAVIDAMRPVDEAVVLGGMDEDIANRRNSHSTTTAVI